MSLIKMLTFAKSLGGVPNGCGLYQAGQENLVPDFTRGGPCPIQIAEEPSLDGAGRMRMGGDLVQLKKGRPMREQSTESAKVTGAGLAVTGLQGRWLGSRFSARTAVRSDAKGELTLEFVKVVRNDLSDADLELMSARPKASTSSLPSGPQHGPGEGAHPESPTQPGTSRWGRWTSRLFGTGATPG